MKHPQLDLYNPGQRNRQVFIWLLLCAATIYAMIILGGVTRLTHSGLSIVDWKPVSGIVPPLNESAWRAEFERYREFPEYQKTNRGMSLAEFKRIFYFEYSHRLLGRFIGLIFLLPFLYFYFKRWIAPGLTPKLAVIFALGGLQGMLGWYMVKSGLVDVPRVSQYRLAAHLGMAVIIYAYIMWLAFTLLPPPRPFPISTDRGGRYYGFSLGLVGLVFVMILSGAFVAGTRAGFAYPTFPLMAGAWIPDGLFALQPGWRNFFENLTTVQFVHRLLAYLILFYAVGLGVFLLRGNTGGHVRAGALILLAAVVVQLSLGIATLLMHVPVALAVMHQAGAIFLFTVVLFLAHRLRGEEIL